MTGALPLSMTRTARLGSLAEKYNNELVDINRINDEKTGEHRAFLREKLEKHLLYTGSERARWMLENFNDVVNRSGW